MQAAYKRYRVILVLMALFGLVLVDHLHSPTFAFNMGKGNAETTLNQRDSTACAPCGAPCPSSRD